ncbi:SipW-dependent-type signal peptide-containing protein [Halopenitus salinus]|uniref:SipW-dependent-type signal peptide-containing protein n=1 Tax=Halopenitus salinus TaxID=1198295 RepID=A0ABD5UY87_9EURY
MSKQDKLGLSRRRVLASMGAIGVASAGAGLGTTAYFSDEESFTGNTLTAGELDLKVDWQQTYNGPIPGSDGEVGEHAVNAYPDTAMDDQSYGDGLQDLDGVHYSGAGDVEPVFNAAEIPACCDCEDDEYYLTYGGESYCIEPVTSADSIEDFYDYVEAGGSVQYSSQNDDIQREDTSVMFLHEDDAGDLSLVFVHDAYTNEDGGGAASVTIEGAPSSSGWLVGSGDWQVKDDIEGNESQGFEQYEEWEVDWAWGTDRTDGGAIGHLEDDFALRISAAFNQAADRNPLGSGQIEELVVLSGGSGFGSSDEIVVEEVTQAGDNVDQITIHSSCGIDSGVELDVPAVFQSENYPDQEHLVEFADVKPGDSGEITFSLHLCDNPGYVWMTAANFSQNGGTLTEPERETLLDGEYGNDGEVDLEAGRLADHVDVTVWYDDDCDNVYDDPEEVEQAEEGEEAIFEGTLQELMENTFELEDDEDDGMIPLGVDDGDQECYPARAGFCIGFEWEVSTEVGNEIQGDEAHFDLGFYTEQCRHNDDPGNATAENDSTENGTEQTA